jgi:hypothetical protein
MTAPASLALTETEFLDVVSEASRAPSVHNIQPSRFRHSRPGAIELSRDRMRSLPVCDPEGRDVRMSLGASCEGLAIALSRRGFGLVDVILCDTTAAEAVAELRFERRASHDVLVRHVFRRSTWRRSFRPASADALAALDSRVRAHHAVWAADRESVTLVSRLIDPATRATALEPAAWGETWRWLRLTRGHEGWSRDGLNAEALGLSSLEAAVAKRLLKPETLRWLRWSGVDVVASSEAAQVRSASGLIGILSDPSEDPFAVGRRLYRIWLEVTAIGLSLCPMSALAEWDVSRSALDRHWRVPAGQQLVNVLRVGDSGTPKIRLTPRLPPGELILR